MNGNVSVLIIKMHIINLCVRGMLHSKRMCFSAD